MNTLTIEYTAKAGGKSTKFKSEEVEADQLIDLEREGIGIGEIVTFNVVFDYAKLLAFFVGCRNSAGTTGSGEAKFTVVPKVTAGTAASSPATITITPRIGKAWSSGDVENDVNPFTAAVATIVVTNTGTKKGDFFGQFLVDSTPASPG